jgi:hypothetical protein
MKHKALLIGINYVGTSSELSGCINDVNNSFKYLTSSLQCCDVTILKEGDATRNNILSNLHRLIEESNKEDTKLFVHYSGHGSQTVDMNHDEDSADDEKSGMDSCLVPVDFRTAGMIIDDDLRTVICKLTNPNSSLFFIADACFSGSVLDLRYLLRLREHNKKAEYDFHLDKQYPETSASIILLSGCRDNQTSADTFDDDPLKSSSRGMAQGALTHAFLNTMENNKNINYHDLLVNIRQELKSKMYDQIPQLSFGKNFNIEQQIEF